ncbi:MAG: hypothetical protein HRF49_11165 [bacterium]|jgi:hypothetical protein
MDAGVIIFGLVGIVVLAVIISIASRPRRIIENGQDADIERIYAANPWAQKFGQFTVDKKYSHSASDRKYEERYPDAPEFRDYRAEDLLDERKYKEAEEYLRQMADIAKAEGNNRRLTTYRYYFGRLIEFRQKYPAQQSEESDSRIRAVRH